MSQVTQVLKRGWTVLYNEGPVTFLKNARAYLQRIDISKEGVTISYQTGTRVDFEERWELVKGHVEEEDSTVLDIGCAEGHLTARFAELGLMAIGIERHAHSVTSARASNGTQSNLGFLQYDVTPETIDSVPSVDIVLLLTVYHHWVTEFGWEKAEEMMRVLGEKCNKLFFEMPNRMVDRPPIPDYSGDSLIEYYTEYLNLIYDGDVTVEHLGTTDYKGGERKDLLFAVDFE